jgi:hypothetical protein
MKQFHRGIAGFICGGLALVSLPNGWETSTTTSRPQPEAQTAQIAPTTAVRTFETAGKPERVVIPFDVSRVYPEETQVRVQTSTRAVWEWLELGFVVTLASSALASVFLAALLPAIR